MKEEVKREGLKEGKTRDGLNKQNWKFLCKYAIIKVDLFCLILFLQHWDYKKNKKIIL